MPVFKIKNNRVIADDVEQDHTHVRVVWFGPSEDGKHRRVFNGPLLPIEGYRAAVDWAIGMAGQMVHPLYVVPFDGTQALAELEMERSLANLEDRERGDLRHFMATRLAQIMRDCDEPEVRSEAYSVLVGLKAVQP